MNATLFHREVYMPEGVRKLANMKLSLIPTRHATEAALSDRYGKLNIPAAITFNGADVIEAEVTDRKLSKLVVRLPYDSTRDAIYVVKPDGTLKTVWFNPKSDLHKTLDRSKYASR